ncbi:Major Facilitator Superfamily protein [Streptomyces zhaozhouensis]|uniref:Major Facilitator Superfamily protein n=1 Tax=Streptomyces zhaozhouensis TaxID=1300267 RepID=A0A286DU81_9ACTN|nr:MFS transporter [Streptomyces zhaozhouensis]SOD62153.1 Major Facilitator Superfamily protein [Streptomyces zhaozhouensis]
MLKDSSFRNLWTAQTVSLFGTQACVVIIPLLALETLDASAFEMGLLGSAESLAVLLLGLWIGVTADRYPRRSVMVTSNILRLLLIGLIPVAYVLDVLSIPLLFVAVFLVGALTLLYDSALSSHVVMTFDRRQLPKINSYMEGSTAVSEVAGPGLGGLLVQALGAPLALVADVCSYVVSTVLLLRPGDGGKKGAAGTSGVNTTETHAGQQNAGQGDAPDAEAAREGGEQESVKGTLSGFTWAFSHRVLRPVIVSAAHFNFFTAMFFAVYTFYVVKELGFSPLLVGLASTAGGLGGVLAATAASSFMSKVRTQLLYVLSLVVPTVGAFLVPGSELLSSSLAQFLSVAAGMFLWSFAIVVNLVMSETIKQMVTPSHIIGQVTSAMRFTTLGFEPVGAIVGGTVSQFLSPATALVIAACGLATSVVWVIFNRHLGGYDVNEEEPVSAT